MFTQEAAQFIVNANSGTVPREALAIARSLFLDFVGVALAGSREPASQLIIEYLGENGGSPVSTVMGTRLQTSPAAAALANGVMGHALDYDDYCVTWIAHPSVAILPAVLALGEKGRISGQAALVAYIVGFEVGAALGLAIGRRHYDAGWHNTSTLGSIAAAASACKVLRLDVEQTRMAMGIAASLAGGLRQNFGTMTKPLHAGKAASNGVTAALLAQKGFTADGDILEAPLGFVKVFGGVEGKWDRARQELSGYVSFLSPGINVKPYPSCGGTHSGIDAMLHLRTQYGLRADNVVEIECVCRPMEIAQLIHHRPKTGLEAKFSMEYCLARALIDGSLSVKHFADEKVTEPEAQDLLNKVKLVSLDVPYRTGEIPQEVTIRLKDGRSFTHKVVRPKGNPEQPLTREELRAKYDDCASGILPAKNVVRCMDLLLELDKLGDISELMALLSTISRQ